MFAQSTPIENVTFSCKTALLKEIFNSNRMVGTKWTYHKKQRCKSDYLFFKIYFQYKTTFERVDLMYQLLKYSHSYFS